VLAVLVGLIAGGGALTLTDSRTTKELIDWDSICLGPAAFDHAALMTWAERWGGLTATYRDFARGYGADLREAPLARELAALRLLAPTINVIINGATDEQGAAEARERMRCWLGDPAAPPWTPF
jgi:Ser/Thr protein kinase RdoA (MazF antagonist)